MTLSIADLLGTGGTGGLVETDATDVALQLHLDAAADLVVKEAPLAPDSIHNAAVLRVVGWFLNQPSSARRSTRIGEYSESFVGLMDSNVIRHSGAGRLLSGYKERRGGSI